METCRLHQYGNELFTWEGIYTTVYRIEFTIRGYLMPIRVNRRLIHTKLARYTLYTRPETCRAENPRKPSLNNSPGLGSV